MEDKFVKFTHEEVEIVGEVIELRGMLLVVEILEPFCNYSSFLYLAGPGAPSLERFREEYKEYAQELLIELYKKLKWMDVRIEKICGKYDLYIEELEALKVVGNRVVKERIEDKLKEAFFNDAFRTLLIGFQFTPIEERRILDILEIYKLVNCKIYIT